MLSERDLRELLEFSSSDPVVSVYLDTDPAGGNADAYRLRLRSLLKEVDLPQDVQAIERYFDREHTWTGRSVVVFSCASKNYFKAYPLAISVQDRVRVDNRPTVKPLVDLLDVYGGYGVALVDKQGARLFSIHLGELCEQEGVLGEAVKHTKHGGASAVPGRRGGVAGQTHYDDELVERNMKETVDFAVRFFEENHIRRILIGGTEDNVAKFRGLLPKSCHSLVVGTFPMSMTASTTEVLDRAMQIGVAAEQRREAKLVENVITTAAKGNGGVIGLDDTLKAIHDGRVQVLLTSSGYRAAGYRCGTCGFMTSQPSGTCQFCGGTFIEITDAIEFAVQGVMQSGGEVEVIHQNESLDSAGKIGAILRY